MNLTNKHFKILEKMEEWLQTNNFQLSQVVKPYSKELPQKELETLARLAHANTRAGGFKKLKVEYIIKA